MTVDLGVRTITDWVDERIAPVKPFRAIVTSAPVNGLVAIKRPEAASAGTALYAKIAGFGVAVGDEVLCVNLGKFPVIIGKIQRAAQSGVVLDGGPGIYYGTGSPEGVVTATVGSVYHETDGTSLTATWAKASGTGAFGWVPLDGFVRTRSERAWQKDHGAATLSTFGMTAPTVTGTPTSADTASPGNNLNLATTAVSGNAVSIVTPNLIRSDQGYEWTCRVVPIDTTLVRYWVGMFSATPVASDTPAVMIAGFRASTGVPDANWKCITSDGVSVTTVDSGVVFDSTTHYFRVVATSTLVLFYIDDAYVGQSITNLPTSGTSLAHYAAHTTLTTAAKNARYGFLRALTK